MDDYIVYLHFDLIDGFPARGVQRKQVMDFIRSLAQNPHTVGDFSDRDGTLRVRQVKIIGNLAVTYWVDDPVKAVMVVSVDRADA